MVVWRRWVFPILMVLVFGVIAASLSKIAFFPDEQPGGEEVFGAISDPVVSVERGQVVNDLLLPGTIARDAEVVVRADVDGTISAVHVKSGAKVTAGQALFTVKQDWPVAYIDVTAPEAGTLGEVGLVAGQGISVGTEAMRLSPERFHMLSTVQPVQLYRLLDAPSEGLVSIAGGPEPFTCSGLQTQVAEDGTTSVRCAIPKDQVVFPGLPAELSISIGVAEDVLTVPTTAVKGGSGSGLVWVDGGEGTEPEQRSVTLGISDGSIVEVTEGLEEGELIRQFVPGAAAPVEEFCYEIAPGEEYCESGVSW